MSLLERISDRIDATGDCWEWTGAVTTGGYGSFRPVPSESPTTAHRAVYEFLVGDIPEGLDLDHLCRNRSCVNPDHLEPVTRIENMKRASKRRTSCPRGHRMIGENLVIDQGSRRCRTCVNMDRRLRYHDHKRGW